MNFFENVGLLTRRPHKFLRVTVSYAMAHHWLPVTASCDMRESYGVRTHDPAIKSRVLCHLS